VTHVLVLGAGSIGTRHARNLVAAGARVAVADPEPDRARLIDDTTPVPFDLDRVVDFDAVVVASPTSEHREQALATAGRDLPTLVEKPLAASGAGVDALRPFARHITVGFNLRFHRPVRLLAELVHRGAIGRPVAGRLWFGSWLPDWRPRVDYRTTYSARSDLGGGVLLDAIHELDLLVWLFGAQLEVVGSVVDRVGPLEIDVEDTVKALIRTASGVPVELTLDYLSRRYRRGIEVIGDEGTVRLDWARGTLEHERGDHLEVRPARTPLERSYEAEARHFLAFARGEAGPSVDLDTALASLALADRIRQVAS
jgi:predicted dehydrogenase